MHEHNPGTTRRAVLRSLPTPVDVTPDSSVESDVWVQDAPPLLAVIDDLAEPRLADLDALLRDVDRLRSNLRRDLTLAATAAQAGETELAGWLLSQDQSLRTFESVALGRLSDLEGQERVEQHVAVGQRRSRWMLTAAPFAAAAAFVFAFIGGVVPSTAPEPVTSPRTSSVALESYEAFTQLALEGGSTSAITAAAEKFHDDLASLVDSPLTDPAAVNHAILLLQSERAVLIAGGDSSRELTQILREADRLVARLRAGLARRPLAGVAVPALPQPDRAKREPERKASSPKPSSTPSASPSASASTPPTPSAKPSASASPTPTPSQGPGTSPTDAPLPKSPPVG